MNCYIFLSNSEKETHKIAGDLAHKVVGSKIPIIIALEGELGAGKTTFVKGFAKILGIKAKIKSPTFTLMKEYKLPSSNKSQTNSPDFGSDKVGTIPIFRSRTPDTVEVKSRFLDFAAKSERFGENLGKFKISISKHLVHIDCYRVRDHKDLATLNLKLLFNTPENIVLIEWPERISKILPKKLIRVHIDHIDKNSRKIKVTM